MTTNKTKSIITIVLTCIVVICAVVLLYEFIRIANLKSTKNKLQANLTSMQREIDEYTDKNAYYADRETYLEEYAREIYNWGKSDRTYYEE